MADIGQYVGLGGVVASFYGTDVIEIPVALTSSQAALLTDLYTLDVDVAPRVVQVRSSFASDGDVWEGHVHRVEGALDEITRTLRVIVRVEAPYDTERGGQPLLIGSFANVEIEGRRLERFFSLPLDALREGNQLWMYKNGKLSVRNVSVVQIFENTVLVDGGINDGEVVITTRLAFVVDGMHVRAVDETGGRS